MKALLNYPVTICLAAILAIGAVALTGCSTQQEEQSSAATTHQGASDQESIKQSPDKYTWYVKNYVGSNLANVGYASLGGELRDHYGEGSIKPTPIADDGSFVDTEDIEALKHYRVISQSVEPNTEISFTFDPEYESLVKSQSLKEIQLKVTKID